MYQNNEMAAILVYGTGISSFLFKYFVLFHHPTGATDHVSENDLYKIDNLSIVLHTCKFSLYYFALFLELKKIAKNKRNFEGLSPGQTRKHCCGNIVSCQCFAMFPRVGKH